MILNVKQVLSTIKDSQFKQRFQPGKTWVEVGQKSYDSREIIAGIKAVLEAQWSQGTYVARFESSFAKYLHQRYCVTTNSGSSANLLALTALTSPQLKRKRLKPGDEVITTACGFPTTLNPIIQNQLIPVFVDIDIPTLNVNPRSLSQALSAKTRAIIFSHTLGNPFDLAAVVKFCQSHHLYLIEDNCDALGSRFKGKLTGTFGDLSTYSFYPAHHMTMGEGGAVVTNNRLLAQIVKSLRDWGRYLDKTMYVKGKLPADYDQRYTFYELGFNLKITEMQAAIGLAQLTKLNRFIKQRIRHAKFLFSSLRHINSLILHQTIPQSQPSWFGFPITIHPKAHFSRQDLRSFLDRRRIDSRLLLAGNLTKQPYFINQPSPYRVVGSLKNTDAVMRQTFWVGCSPSLTRPMLQYVVNSIGEFCSRYE